MSDMKILREYISQLLLLEDTQERAVKLYKTYLKHPDSKEGQTAKRIADKLASRKNIDIKSIEQIAANELGIKRAQPETSTPQQRAKERATKEKEQPLYGWRPGSWEKERATKEKERETKAKERATKEKETGIPWYVMKKD